MRAGTRALLTGAMLLAAAACHPAAPTRPAELAPERRAALAQLVVENRTGRAVDIVFRYAAEPGGEIGVGRVPPGERAIMAPVPAAEPILLFARGPGFERREGPRVLVTDQVWLWVIEPDPPGGTRDGR